MRNVHRVCTECSHNYIPKSSHAKLWTWCSLKCARKAWPNFVQALEGHCYTCNRAIGAARAFCDATCRKQGRHIVNGIWIRGRTGNRVILRCRFCGNAFDIGRTEWMRGGGAYCSHGCAGRNAAEDVRPNQISDAFGYWFAGLTDGEGSFDITADSRKGNSVRFVLKLRDDDRPVLEFIRDTLGFGTLYTVAGGSRGGTKTNPQTSFACQSVKSCLALRDLFDKYPLRSKKARDFAVWRHAVEGLSQGTVTHAEATRLRRLLIDGRSYHGI